MTAPALRLVELQPDHTDVIQSPWDAELERNALGLLMLGQPAPAWLRPEHFFPAHHQLVARHALQLGASHLVAAALRKEGRLWSKETHGAIDRHSAPYLLSSVDLAEMVEEAVHAERMGWRVEWEQLRELANRRALCELMARLCIRLRAGDVGHEEARCELREHFKAVKV